MKVMNGIDDMNVLVLVWNFGVGSGVWLLLLNFSLVCMFVVNVVMNVVLVGVVVKFSQDCIWLVVICLIRCLCIILFRVVLSICVVQVCCGLFNVFRLGFLVIRLLVIRVSDCCYLICVIIWLICCVWLLFCVIVGFMISVDSSVVWFSMIMRDLCGFSMLFQVLLVFGSWDGLQFCCVCQVGYQVLVCVIRVMKWLNSGVMLCGFGDVLGWFWNENVGMLVCVMFWLVLLNSDWWVMCRVVGSEVLFIVNLWFCEVIIIWLLFRFCIGWLVLWWLWFILMVLVLDVSVSSWWLRQMLNIGIFLFRNILIVLIVQLYGFGLFGLLDRNMLLGFIVSILVVGVCVGIMVMLQLCLVSMCRMLSLVLKLYVIILYWGVVLVNVLEFRLSWFLFQLQVLLVLVILVRFMFFRFGNLCVVFSVMFMLMLLLVISVLFWVLCLCRMCVSLCVLMLEIVIMLCCSSQFCSDIWLCQLFGWCGMLCMIRLVDYILWVLLFWLVMLVLLICGQVSVIICWVQEGLVSIFW